MPEMEQLVQALPKHDKHDASVVAINRASARDEKL